MTEPTAPAAGETPPAGETETPPPAVTAEDVARLQAALDKERDLRKTRDKELSDFRAQTKASMTDTERAIAEAREAAAAEVRTQYGERLARTEFLAEAAKRNPGFDAAAVLDDLNLARYIGEDGEPDSKAIAGVVGRLIPEGGPATPAPPSFDGGSRQTASSGPSMTQLIRQAAGRA